MKKWMTRLLAGALIIGLCTASVYAVGGGWGGHHRRLQDSEVSLCTAQTCRGDTDGDGLCDLCGLTVDSCIHGCAGQDADGGGSCDIYLGSAGGHHSHRGGGGSCRRS